MHTALHTTSRPSDSSLGRWLTPFLGQLLCLIGLGLAVGCLFGFLCKESLYAPLLSFYQSLSSSLQSLELDKRALFLLALRKHLKYFLLLWFFSFTNIWRYFYRFVCVAFGLQQGLLLSFCILLHQVMGPLHYLSFLFPQVLLLAPAYYLSLQSANTLSCCRLQKKQLLCHQLPLFFLCLALLILGCFVESYLNPILLRALVSL